MLPHLRELGEQLQASSRQEDAGCLTSEKTGIGTASRTSVALTSRGRAALEAYTDALRDLLGPAMDGPVRALRPGE